MPNQNRFAIGTPAQITTHKASLWDLLRTLKPRISDENAQSHVGGGSHVPKPQSVANGLGHREHPTQNLWALLVDKPGDADGMGLLTEVESRPGLRSLLDNGGTMVLPAGQTWPDGSTAPRPNHFFKVDTATTQARYLALLRFVLPNLWSNVKAYVVGDTCRRTLVSGIEVGFRCVVANTNSAPTMNNGNWQVYLGPLPASWNPVLP
jgi:hypothetical protein